MRRIRWDEKDRDGLGRKEMGWEGWRWNGKDRDGIGRIEMKWE